MNRNSRAIFYSAAALVLVTGSVRWTDTCAIEYAATRISVSEMKRRLIFIGKRPQNSMSSVLLISGYSRVTVVNWR